MPGMFSPQPTSKETASSRSQHAPRHVRHARAVMHVGIVNPRWRGKFSRHFRRMRNPQIYVSGKRSIRWTIGNITGGSGGISVSISWRHRHFHTRIPRPTSSWSCGPLTVVSIKKPFLLYFRFGRGRCGKRLIRWRCGDLLQSGQTMLLMISCCFVVSHVLPCWIYFIERKIYFRFQSVLRFHGKMKSSYCRSMAKLLFNESTVSLQHWLI